MTQKRLQGSRILPYPGFGRVDVLVNNAGIFIPKPFTEYTTEDLNALVSTTLAGFLYVSQLSEKALASSWKNSRNPCCQVFFQRIADLSVSSRRKLHRAQPLVQQLVFFEKRVTQSFAFR